MSAKRDSRFKRLRRQVGLCDAIAIKILETFGIRKICKVQMSGIPIFVRTMTHDLVIAAEFLSKRPWEDLTVEPASAIIDAGANIGASTVYLAHLFPDSKIIAIEPERENFSLLEKNTKHHKNVKCIRAALWNERMTMDLVDRTGGTIGFTIAQSKESNSETGQTVECLSIEELCSRFKIRSIGFLKLDIEGAEKNVLENSEQWIGRVEVIAAELHDQFVPGCKLAFDNATVDFSRFERREDKEFAFRDRQPEISTITETSGTL
jgi:FkbM family methyltransferase